MIEKLRTITKVIRGDPETVHNEHRRRVLTFILFTLAVCVVILVSFIIHWTNENETLKYPTNLGPEITRGIDSTIQWVVINGEWFFDGIRDAIQITLGKLRDVLIWIPWPVMVAIIFLLGWRMSTFRVGAFSALGMMAIGLVNLWEPAMITIALMAVSVSIAIVFGISAGIIMARSNFVESLMRPVLDAMQTMPSFVYLVPGIMLFGLGNVGAILATVLYAIPPCIRLTNLGIRQVDPSAVEAGRSFGSTPLQLLYKVQIPMAIPTIMAGINQTVMMALAMSTIAAMVGAGGLGIEVLRSMGQLEEGKAFVAGTAIVLMAIIFDRISQGYVLSRND